MTNRINIARQKYIYILTCTLIVCFSLINATYFSYYFDKISIIFSILGCALFIVILIISNSLSKNIMYYLTVGLFFILMFLSSLYFEISRELILKLIYLSVIFITISIVQSSKLNYLDILFTVCKIFAAWILINHIINFTIYDYLPTTSVSSELMYNYYQIETKCFIFFRNFSGFNIGNLNLYRACAPFGEPGIAQIYLNFGLIYALYNYRCKNRFFWIALFSIAVMLGLSLIGVLITLIVFLIYVLYKRKYKIFIFLIALSLMCMIIMIYEKNDTFSYFSRIDDYEFMFYIIKDLFPFGTGVGNAPLLYNDIKNQIYHTIGTTGYYCGLLYPLMEMGIFGILYYVMLMMVLFGYSKNCFERISIFVLITITLLTEPQYNNTFILGIIFSSVYIFYRDKMYNKLSLIDLY